jgi:hypothetical protein
MDVNHVDTPIAVAGDCPVAESAVPVAPCPSRRG